MAKKKSKADSRTDSDEGLPPRESLRQLALLARRLRGLGHAGGLNPAQWEALRYLASCEPAQQTPGHMARYLGATKGTTSQTVLSLEKKGLIAKRENLSDSRSVTLYFTDEGRARLDADPLLPLLSVLAELKPKTRRRFDKAVAALLASKALSLATIAPAEKDEDTGGE